MVTVSKPSRFLLTMLTVCGVLAGSSHVAYAERMSSDVNSRLNSIEERLTHLNRAPISGNPSSLASFQVELSKLQEELRAIRGGIEENRFAIEQMQRDMKLSHEDYDYRMRALEQRASGVAGATADMGAGGALQPTPHADAPPTAPVVAPSVRAPMNPVAQPTVQPLGSALPPTTPVVKPPVASAPVTPPVVPNAGTAMHFTDPHEHYNYAVSLIKNKQYPEARTSFQEFVSKYKGDKLAGNAYYWLGETYYVGSDFVTAADNFRQGFEVNPNGVKAPDNLYKLAKSLLRLEKKQEACVVLSQIQKRYKTRNPEVVGLAFETQKANNCQ